jgi:hypothetical protein
VASWELGDNLMDKVMRKIYKNETIESLKRFKTFLCYNPKTGDLTYKDTRNGSKVVGEVAGFVDRGYLRIWNRGRIWFCHRIAWALYYGEWPWGTVDHINGIGDDNRITNLRVCSNSDNMKNRKPYSNKIFKGVYRKDTLSWKVYVTVNGKQSYVGSYTCLGQALKAYDAKAKELHGEYARLNLPTLEN